MSRTPPSESGVTAPPLFYYADYRQALEHNPLYSGYLTQCWSLAVEEQFYLVWAALLLVALKFGRRRLAYALACTGIIACTANRFHIVLDAHPWTIFTADRTYYAFDTRADALFVGCLLGLIATGGHLDGWKPMTRRVLAASALVSTCVMAWIIVSVTIGSRSVPLIWIPVSEIACAVILTYLFVQTKGVGSRILGLSLLVLIGDMSYTIYLIHWPVSVAMNPTTVDWPLWQLNVVRIAIVLLVAGASWFLMERPLMRWRHRALDPTRAAADSESPVA